MYKSTPSLSLAVKPFKILIVDDNFIDRETWCRYLKSDPENEYLFSEAETGAEGLDFVYANNIDGILLDYKLLDMDGLEFIAYLNEEGISVPVIMLTGQGNEMIAVKALKLGVQDYLVKGDITPEGLKKTLHTAISYASLQKKVEEQRRQLAMLAMNDELTGLYNRRVLFERLKTEVDRSLRYQVPCSLILLDIDHFKNVNDTWGHLAGDKVLRILAGLLSRSKRQTDVVARYGGEEFCIILPETDLKGAYKFAERLRGNIAAAEFRTAKNELLTVTCSLGVSMVTPRIHDVESFLQEADTALYAAKEAGRNCVRLFKAA